MERTCRFAVIALGAVTLSNVVNVARLSGQTAPAVIWNFDSLSPGQPPAGFAFAAVVLGGSLKNAITKAEQIEVDVVTRERANVIQLAEAA